MRPESLLTHRLANGLRIVGRPMPDAESVAVAYYIDTGARDESDPALEGISHFLEHLLFKGTATMNRQQLDQAFTRLGAKRNGFTSIEHTLYYVQVLREYLAEAFNLLSAMMFPRFQEEEFQTEKEVIVNEIARAEDQPHRVALWQMMRAYFGAQPLGNKVLGSRESIRNLRLDQIRTYWRQRYVAPNSILTIAGNFVWESFVEAAERQTTSWPSGPAGRRVFPYEPAMACHQVHVNKQRKQQLLLLAMPMVARGSEAFEAAHLGASILGRAQGSRFYWDIVHKGLALSASASLWALEGTGLLLLRANVDPRNAQQVLSLLRGGLETFLEQGIAEDELQRAKALWMFDLVRSTESPYLQMWNGALDWAAEQRLVPLDERIARIQKVTAEDVFRVFRQFPLQEKQVLTTYGPLTEQQLGLSTSA